MKRRKSRESRDKNTPFQGNIGGNLVKLKEVLLRGIGISFTYTICKSF
jgi:hypothetical protein